MTLLAGTMGLLSHPSRHAAAAFFSGHLVLLVLLFGGIVLALLAAPVLFDALSGSVQAPATKWSPAVFVIGLGVLLIGVFSGTPVLDAIGAILMGLVLIGALMFYY